MSDQPADITIYTDGACRPNPGVGGYGIVLITDGQRRELAGGFRKTTNNRMELFSIIRALRELPPMRSNVTIYSDSQYVVNMYNGGHAHTWRQNKWTRNRGKDPALNPDLWDELLNLGTLHTPTLVWVRGHADNKENTRCDELAVAARLCADLPPDAAYEALATIVQPVQLTLF